MTMDRVRVFLALNLPIRVIEEVRAEQDKLRGVAEEAGMEVAWIPPPNMHVTLKFLGQVPVESAVAIQDLLAPRLEAHAPLSLNVSGTGAFPDRERPRVLWVGVSGDGLDELAGSIDTWLDEELGFDREKRPFHAHLTLGRVKNGGGVDLLEGLEEHPFGSCVAHEVVLYKSVLQRHGAEYTPLARFALSGRAAG